MIITKIFSLIIGVENTMFFFKIIWKKIEFILLTNDSGVLL